MTGIPIGPGERVIDKWTLNYHPPAGGRYLGELIVTERNVFFEADFDISIEGVTAVTGGIKIPRDQIATVEQSTRFWFFKRVELTLGTGVVHVFERGVMSAAPIAAALGYG